MNKNEVDIQIKIDSKPALKKSVSKITFLNLRNDNLFYLSNAYQTHLRWTMADCYDFPFGIIFIIHIPEARVIRQNINPK